MGFSDQAKKEHCTDGLRETGLVTLTFMTTCVVSVFFGKGMSPGVLVLPIGTLFAFTQLRATLPGFRCVCCLLCVLPHQLMLYIPLRCQVP